MWNSSSSSSSSLSLSSSSSSLSLILNLWSYFNVFVSMMYYFGLNNYVSRCTVKYFRVKAMSILHYIILIPTSKNVRVRELDAQNFGPIYIIFWINLKLNECEGIGYSDLGMPNNLPQNHFIKFFTGQKWQSSQFTKTEYKDML